jgi:uncharacterized protein
MGLSVVAATVARFVGRARPERQEGAAVQPVWAGLAAGGAAFGAGIVNAVAGGGTLITFPALVALGLPTVTANVTNTVALCPGYFGGTYAQRRDLVIFRHWLRPVLIAGGIGGLAGSILLVTTPEDVFRGLVPFFILLACALLAFQDLIKAQIVTRWRAVRPAPPHQSPVGPAAVAAIAGVYGGYFGAGLGIMLLALLGLLLEEPLAQVNALKQALSLVINLVAGAFFVFSGKVAWGYAAVMAVGSLAGGHVGGRLAGRLNAHLMRLIVVVFGVAVAIKFLF